MAGIAKTDVYVYKALYQSDELTAGGPPGPVIVVDGEINNLFENIARLDHIKGSVQLRKAFIRVNSEADEIYAGTHVALMTIPADPLVDVIIIPSGGHFEDLEEILEYIHDSTQREFFSALALHEAAAIGAEEIKVPDYRKTIFPVAKVEEDIDFQQEPPFIEGGQIAASSGDPWELDGSIFLNFIAQAINWSAIGESTPARPSDTTYYIELENLLKRDSMELRVFARISNKWQEYRTANNNTRLQDVNSDSYTTFTLGAEYTVTGCIGTASFKLPDSLQPDVGSRVIVVYPCATSVVLLNQDDCLTTEVIKHGVRRTCFCLDNQDPIVPGTLQVSAAVFEGGSAVFDDVSGTGILFSTAGSGEGTIDYITGFVSIELAESVDDVLETSMSLLATGKYIRAVNDFENWDDKKFQGDGKEPVVKAGDVVVIYDSGDPAIEEMALVTEVAAAELYTTIKLNTPLAFAHPVETTLVSTVLETGTLQANVGETFTQESWDFATWTNEQEGGPAYGNYGFVNYPVLISNAGCTTERWLLRVVAISPFSVDIIGEHVGTIAENVQCRYILGDLLNEDERYHLKNPNTGQPYFTLEPQGWGNGVLEGQGAANWQVGNILRINTEGPEAPFWLLRTIKPSPSEITDDSATIQIRGDVEIIT